MHSNAISKTYWLSSLTSLSNICYQIISLAIKCYQVLQWLSTAIKYISYYQMLSTNIWLSNLPFHYHQHTSTHFPSLTVILIFSDLWFFHALQKPKQSICPERVDIIHKLVVILMGGRHFKIQKLVVQPKKTLKHHHLSKFRKELRIQPDFFLLKFWFLVVRERSQNVKFNW